MLQAKVIDLNRVVTDTVQMLKRLIGEDIELISILDPDLFNIEADPGQLSQVIMNLAVNARDAMPDGGTITFETNNVTLDETYAKQHVSIKPGPYVVLLV